jgi:hypothetical protein
MNRKPSSMGIAELEPRQPASSVHWGPGPRVVYVMHGFGRRVDLDIVGRTSGSLRSHVGEKSNTMDDAHVWGGPTTNAHMWGLGREGQHDGRCAHVSEGKSGTAASARPWGPSCASLCHHVPHTHPSRSSHSPLLVVWIHTHLYRSSRAMYTSFGQPATETPLSIVCPHIHL